MKGEQMSESIKGDLTERSGSVPQAPLQSPSDLADVWMWHFQQAMADPQAREFHRQCAQIIGKTINPDDEPIIPQPKPRRWSLFFGG
jgi:hypothetical protein